jgi:hypothetical protein
MAGDKKLSKPSSRSEIDAFLSQVKNTPAPRSGGGGRLIFALDATASREATWDHASQLQAQMFQQTAALGGLNIQLCYYRGFGEFHATPWLNNTGQLLRQMSGVRCLAGHTQIEKLLRHAIKENRSLPSSQKINALVFVGDCIEEDVDKLAHAAGQLGLLGVPVFLFQEGHDASASQAFKHIAQLTGGAHCPFDAGSARQLRDLLSAVAVYAAGGQTALEDFHRKRGQVVLRLGRKEP